MTEMQETLKEHIDIQFNTEVEDIIVEDNTIKGIKLAKGDIITASKVLLAPGRDGATWLDSIFKNMA